MWQDTSIGVAHMRNELRHVEHRADDARFVTPAIAAEAENEDDEPAKASRLPCRLLVWVGMA